MKKTIRKLLILLNISLILSSFQGIGQTQSLSLKYRSLQSERYEITNQKYLESNLFNSNYYCLLQFSRIPDEKEQILLRTAGIKLLDYVKYTTYVASISEETLDHLEHFDFIWSVHSLLPSDKIHRSLHQNIPPYSILKEGFVDVSINWFPGIKPVLILAEIQKLNIRLLTFTPNLGNLTARIPINRVQEIGKTSWLYWMEPINHPLSIENLPGKTNHRSNVLASNSAGGRKLTGKGVRVGIWDNGQVGQHIDLDYRLAIRETDQAVKTHATHCSGTICGAGLLNEFYQGMSTKSLLYSWDFYGWIPHEMDTARIYDSINVTSNSYVYTTSWDTCNHRGYYDIISYLLDRLVTIYPDFIHVYAAGNSQSQCGNGGFRTVSSGFQASKNIIVVGAVNYIDAMSGFSSWGPMRDGRLKPEITSVGVNVKSTLPNDTYSGNSSGTSMATPGVAGTVAQLYERFKQIYGNYPNASTLKAILCNTALDLGNPGPDYKYGFGRIDGLKAAEIIEEEDFIADSLSHGQTQYDTIVIGQNVKQLKIMMCYSDLPASQYIAFDSTTIINHLDLKVYDASMQLFRPYVLDPFNPDSLAKAGTDTLNNMEQVVIDNPSSGTYYIAVEGILIPSGKQGYSITWDKLMDSVVVTYPVGGESLSPGITETIRWNSFGNTGYFTVEFSSDSGSNWQTLSAYVPSNRLYYNWTVPSTISKNCLIRVTSGNSLTGQSMSVFSIMNRPDTVSAKSCKNQVHLYWNPTPSAASYDVFQVQKGQWQLLDHVQDTFYTVPGLSDTIKHYFSIQAYDSFGAVSPKAPALAILTDSTFFPAQFILQPKGDTICNGDGFSFMTSVSGTDTISKQWQVSYDQGQSWQDIGGATDTFLTFSSVSAPMDGFQYRMYISNSCLDVVFSEEVSLRVASGISVLKNPEDLTVCYSQPFHFSGRFENLVPFTMQWELSQNNGFSWSPISGKTDTLLNMSGSPINYNQSLFRLKAIDQCLFDTFTSSARLTVRYPLSVQISKSADTICYGLPVHLLAQAYGGDTQNYNYYWKGKNSTAFQITDTPLVNSWYHVSLFDSCSLGPVYDSVYIVVRNPLSVSISTTADTICYGNSVTLTAHPGGGDSYYNYSWSGVNPSTKSIVVNPVVSSMYYLNVSDSCNQSVIDSFLVVVKAPLKVAIIANEDSICNGQELQLFALASGGDSSAYKYSWNQGTDSSANYSDFPSSASSYSVQLMDDCSTDPAEDSIEIYVYPSLKVELHVAGFSCEGDLLDLEALASGGKGNNYHYLWFPASVDSSKVSLIPTQSDWYKIILSDECNSTPDMDSAYSFVNMPNPGWSFSAKLLTVDFTGEDSMAQSYLWDFGDGFSSTVQNPSHLYSSKGEYIVCLQITDSLACVDSNCKKITVSDIGINASKHDALKIYPNPNKGEFDIQLLRAGPIDFSIRILNSIGEEIYVQDFKSSIGHNYHLHIPQADRGLHFVELRSGNQIFRQKFMIY